LSLVGIIANPASGKDVRRVASQAVTVSNHQKVMVVRQMLIGLLAAGVERIRIMPDSFSIGTRALEGLRNRPDIAAATAVLDMPWQAVAEDSERAACLFRDAGAGCLIVLGGDGTCRLAAGGCGEVPLLGVSSGTNNVVPSFLGGAIAGFAAGFVARHTGASRRQFCYRHKKLLAKVNGLPVGHALVDIGLIDNPFSGSGAVWEPASLRQVFVTRAEPFRTGLSSVIGMVRPVDPAGPKGAWVSVGHGHRTVAAAIAPGSFAHVSIGDIEDLLPGIPYPVAAARPAILSLDGERELPLREGDAAEILLDPEGPWIVDVGRTLSLAVERQAFELTS
jgi:hypothetical protein